MIFLLVKKVVTAQQPLKIFKSAMTTNQIWYNKEELQAPAKVFLISYSQLSKHRREVTKSVVKKVSSTL